MRSACYGERFYQTNKLPPQSGEVKVKRYCVLHFPGKEKSADFRIALQL